jgi:hypothetical protein
MTVFVRAEDIADEIATRIQGITIANGYETDIGVKLMRGRRKIPADDDPPCSVLIEGNDSVDDTNGRTQAARVKIRVPYMVDGFDRCDPNNPNVKAHAMIRDIKRAIFKGDANLGGRAFEVKYVGRDIGPRPDGVGLVQARVAFEVVYAEDLANP